MRALCGAIVTAGAMIGLGLTAIGYGLRFQGMQVLHPDSQQLYGIPTLVLILVLLIIGMLIGVAVAFIGLAYHHERRFFEQQRSNQAGPESRPVGL